MKLLKWCSGLILALWLLDASGQQPERNPYHLPLVTDTLAYNIQLAADSNMKMVDLEKYIPGLIADIRYATTNNFTGRKIYEASRAFARLPVAKALLRAAEDLHSQGIGIKVFDAYRPYAATLLFYETMKDTVFCAPPWKGSRHNRGCALDVSLVDLATGKDLEMPTPYDEFSVRAHPTYSDLPKKAILNRGFLIRTMMKYGFTVFPDEWWHFDYQGWEKFPLMDIPFLTLDKMQ